MTRQYSQGILKHKSILNSAQILVHKHIILFYLLTLVAKGITFIYFGQNCFI